jgi:hypothetical protein
MKMKLAPIKTFENRSPPGRSLLSISASDTYRRPSTENRFPPLSLPTNLPFHPKSSVLDSPDRYTQTPLHSAVSPRSAPFQLLNGHSDQRSGDTTDQERSPRHRSRRTNSGSLPDDATVCTQSSFEHVAEDMDMEETSSMRRLRIDDYHSSGLKRRASSPPGDEPTLHNVPSQGDLFRRREITSRGSPTPRLTPIPQGSISSISSAGRSSSYTSNISIGATSSISSVNSYGRRSPNSGLSPCAMSPVTTEPACHSPFTTPTSLNPSPRASISRPQHQRNISETRPLASPRKLTEVTKPSGTKMQGFFMCDCCPKKPKKFQTLEELR